MSNPFEKAPGHPESTCPKCGGSGTVKTPKGSETKGPETLTSKVVGDQAFSPLGGEFAKPGQLNVTYDAVADRTVVTGNVDNDAEAEVMIILNGHVGLTESDFIL